MSKRRDEDRAKRRRDYLLRLTAANLLVSIGFVGACSFGILTVLSVIVLVFMVLLNGNEIEPAWRVLFLIGPMFSALLSFLAYKLLSSAGRRVMRLPYVPPVREQVAALRVDEVLLRGTGKPPSLPGELLRPANVRAINPEEELRPAAQGRQKG